MACVCNSKGKAQGAGIHEPSAGTDPVFRFMSDGFEMFRTFDVDHHGGGLHFLNVTAWLCAQLFILMCKLQGFQGFKS